MSKLKILNKPPAVYYNIYEHIN